MNPDMNPDWSVLDYFPLKSPLYALVKMPEVDPNALTPKEWHDHANVHHAPECCVRCGKPPKVLMSIRRLERGGLCAACYFKPEAEAAPPQN